MKQFPPWLGQQPEDLDVRLQKESDAERQRRIALYRSFQDSPLKPKCDVVYYPGCGTDDATTEAFPESEILLVDIKKSSLEALRKRNHGSNVHIVEASVTEYNPEAVDVLICHGMDNSVKNMDHAIDAIVEGGFLLSGDDGAGELRADFLHHTALEFVGILRPTTQEASGQNTTVIQNLTRDNMTAALPAFVFEEGKREQVELVESDDEFRRADPVLFARIEREVNIVRAGSKRVMPTSVLEYAKMFPCIGIPTKEPGVSLWIFQKKTLPSPQSMLPAFAK